MQKINSYLLTKHIHKEMKFLDLILKLNKLFVNLDRIKQNKMFV